MLSILYVFFFKQKKEYEMRISYWSSDVCSYDLHRLFPPRDIGRIWQDQRHLHQPPPRADQGLYHRPLWLNIQPLPASPSEDETATVQGSRFARTSPSSSLGDAEDWAYIFGLPG